MSGKTAYRISLIAGLIVVAIFGYNFANPILPCGDAKATPTIVHFELARSVDDLKRIFGPPLNSCTQCSEDYRKQLPAILDGANRVDMRVIIPSYAVFLIFFFAAGRDPRWWRIGVALTVVAFLADYVEDYYLSQLSQQHDMPTVWLAHLPWATGVKWIAIALAGLAASLVLGGRGGWNWGWTAVGVAGVAGTVAAVVSPEKFFALAQLSGAIWPVLLVIDAQESFKRA